MSGFTIPSSAAFLSNTGTNGGTTALGFNLTAGTNRTAYLTGFSYQATGATTPTTVNIAVSAGSNTYNFSYPIFATAGTMQPVQVFNLDPPAAGNNIVGVTASAPGAGATSAILNTWGYAL